MVPKPHNMCDTLYIWNVPILQPKTVGTQPDGVYTWSHEEIVHSQDCKRLPHTKPCRNKVAVDKKLGCTKLINLYHYSWVYTPSLLSARTLEEDQNLMITRQSSWEPSSNVYTIWWWRVSSAFDGSFMPPESLDAIYPISNNVIRHSLLELQSNKH